MTKNIKATNSHLTAHVENVGNVGNMDNFTQPPIFEGKDSAMLFEHDIKVRKNYINEKYSLLHDEANCHFTTYQVTVGWYTFTLELLNLFGKMSFSQDNGIFGKGSFGAVLKGSIRSSKLAVKRIEVDLTSENKQSTFYSTKLEKVMKQACIFKLLSKLSLAPLFNPMENFDLITFENCIQFHSELCFDFEINAKEELEVLRENLTYLLKQMHKLRIIHGDIKPDNIMYCKSLRSYVFIDFGVSKVLQEDQSKQTLTSYFGTFYFSSQPMKLLRYSKQKGYVNLYKNDWFSLELSIQEIGKKIIKQQSENYIINHSIKQNDHNYSLLEYERIFHRLRMKCSEQRFAQSKIERTIEAAFSGFQQIFIKAGYSQEKFDNHYEFVDTNGWEQKELHRFYIQTSGVTFQLKNNFLEILHRNKEWLATDFTEKLQYLHQRQIVEKTMAEENFNNWLHFWIISCYCLEGRMKTSPQHFTDQICVKVLRRDLSKLTFNQKWKQILKYSIGRSSQKQISSVLMRFCQILNCKQLMTKQLMTKQLMTKQSININIQQKVKHQHLNREQIHVLGNYYRTQYIKNFNSPHYFRNRQKILKQISKFSSSCSLNPSSFLQFLWTKICALKESNQYSALKKYCEIFIQNIEFPGFQFFTKYQIILMRAKSYIEIMGQKCNKNYEPIANRIEKSSLNLQELELILSFLTDFKPISIFEQAFQKRVKILKNLMAKIENIQHEYQQSSYLRVCFKVYQMIIRDHFIMLKYNVLKQQQKTAIVDETFQMIKMWANSQQIQSQQLPDLSIQILCDLAEFYSLLSDSASDLASDKVIHKIESSLFIKGTTWFYAIQLFYRLTLVNPLKFRRRFYALYKQYLEKKRKKIIKSNPFEYKRFYLYSQALIQACDSIQEEIECIFIICKQLNEMELFAQRYVKFIQFLRRVEIFCNSFFQPDRFCKQVIKFLKSQQFFNNLTIYVFPLILRILCSFPMNDFGEEVIECRNVAYETMKNFRSYRKITEVVLCFHKFIEFKQLTKICLVFKTDKQKLQILRKIFRLMNKIIFINEVPNRKEMLNKIHKVRCRELEGQSRKSKHHAKMIEKINKKFHILKQTEDLLEYKEIAI